MLKNLVYFLIIIISFHWVQSQVVELSPLSKISLLTVGTGEELAAKFGHSAIRLQDPTLGIDVVYGYGTYDFEDSNFYLNFTRGKLAYTINRMRFKLFEYSYQQEQRWINEQTLNFTLQQRKEIITFLENNLRPENRKYKYDFLFDNCATRIPMVFEKTLGKGLEFDFNHLTNNFTFRELLRQNLNPNTWSNFGIDLALGSVIDRVATPYEHMFLPLYVQKQMQHTRLNGEPIIKTEATILNIPNKEDRTLFILTPAFWLGLLLLLVGWITFKDFKTKQRSKWLDFSLFLVTGLAGFLILFLWFATDHLSTKMNYNALWAFAPNLIVAFYLIKNDVPKWIEKYVYIILLLLVVSSCIWTFKVQVFSILMLLVLSALAIRYIYLFTYFKSIPKTDRKT